MADEVAKPPLNTQQAAIIAMLTALLSALGTSGGLSVLGGSTPHDVTVEMAELRADVKVLESKLDEIIEIIDAAHPRRP